MPTGLIRRGARYSIRRRIPVELVSHYGKAEVVEALGTADPKEARKRLAVRTVELDREWDAVRATLASAPAAKPTAKRDDPTAWMSQEQFEHMVESAHRAEDDAVAAMFERDETADIERELLALADGPADDLTPEQRAFRNLLRDKEDRLKAAEGDASILRQQRKAVVAESRKPADVEAPQSGQATSLYSVVDRRAVEGKLSRKSKAERMAIARWFHERVGDLPVEKITKRDVLTFKQKLLEEGQEPANVKVKLSRLRALLNFAVQQGTIEVNPANGVAIRDPDAAKNKRRSFDRASLAAIFGGPVHALGERPAAGRGEAAYWMPLLALYTGARLEELGQLRPQDVRLEAYLGEGNAPEEAWVINVTADPNDDLKLKNANSERIVPVHPHLEGLGFLAFAKEAQDNKQRKLFSQLRPNQDGRYAAKWGEWFSGYLRNVCGVTDTRMVFHSFRHTFKDAMREIDAPEGLQRQLMGHAGKGVADGYGDGFSTRRLVEVMRRYEVPGFKLPPPPR